MTGEGPLAEQDRPPVEANSTETVLHFGVLGPVRASRAGAALPMGSPLQRALLAALLLRDGRTATAGELIDALWGEIAPSQALAAVRTYASRLRKTLGPGVLRSESGGYAIRITEHALDVSQAEELWAKAQKYRTAGRANRVRELINEALALWDGEPLAGVPGPFAETQRTRLEEWRLQLLETRLETDLEQGRHAEVVSELTALTAAHPLRERLRELLMLALYRSGRQAEALAVYADTRRLLADELGVDPRSALKDLQQRILAADPGLSLPATPAAELLVPQVRPAQLPATVPDFTGRQGSVQELSKVLSSAGGRVMAVSAVAGIGGVGKTTLAVHVAHAVRSAFPDGQLYVDLQGTSARPAEPEAVLRSFLRSLGTADTAIPDTLDERAALYRSVLDDRRVLVLLDNAHDAAQVRPLLPGTENCAALITSRVRMVDLAGAHLVDLDVMSPEEALQLFTRVVGVERVTAERKAALDVVAACGFLPLAIRIAASRLAARRTWTVALLATKLADERRRLDELQAGDLAVKATFELGYGQLEPAQARAFRLLGLADGPDISLAAAAALLDLPAPRTEDLLEVLVDTSLVESAAPGRYRFHDLVRLYARSCAERDEQPADRDAALARLLDFYLATAAGVYAIERPGDRLVEHLEPTEYPGLAFPDRDTGLDWLFTESDPLLACIQQCATGPLLRRATDLLMAAMDLAESGANSRRYQAVAASVSEAARAAGNLLTEGRARTFLALVHSMSGHFQEADDEAVLALKAGSAAGDPLVMSMIPNIHGLIAYYEHRYDDAKEHLQEAVEAFRNDRNLPGEASAVCNLSRIHLAMGETETAVGLASQGMRIYESVGATFRLANAKYALGIVLVAAQRPDEAMQHFTAALDTFRETRQRLWEGMAHFRLAEAHLAAQRPARAAEHAEQALGLRGLGGEWRRGMMLTVLGKALMGIGQRVRAEACWREALAIYDSYDKLTSPEAAEVRALLGTVTPV
ncbi:AfsR/SARP family transcriptional regulator [Streptomyces odontomachi]|uniref:AfsR/SARP family transcriptional regulator n=1 Tax=Streptomyces odontomachi TaxID=2944940 RepID=UPI00210B784F|nr:BTAD domain-containing putative transcriptional regulator [Streptomyces sp. ODS25]